MTTADYANELLAEFSNRPEYHPHRAAFVAALEARGQDARTKQFKHYDHIIKWMIANWPELEFSVKGKG
jgi:hypothetical protein